MHYSYKTKNTCSTQIDFDIIDGKIRNVSFQGGCNGNLKSISRLVDGMDANELVKKLKGVECRDKKTSCGDQFAKAVEEALVNNNS